MTADATKANVATYRQVEFPPFKGEERIFQRFLRPGMGVLDLGCGSGRVTRPLAARGVRVIGADLVAAPLHQIHDAADVVARAIPLLQSDAMAMPFGDGAFDAVVFSYNGLDMIMPEEGRFEALRECARVTAPGGHLIFSSHNPWGALLSPPGFLGLRRLERRWRFLRSGEFRAPIRSTAGAATTRPRRTRWSHRFERTPAWSSTSPVRLERDGAFGCRAFGWSPNGRTTCSARPE